MRKLKGYFLADVKRAFVSSKFLMAIVLMIIILFFCHAGRHCTGYKCALCFFYCNVWNAVNDCFSMRSYTLCG